MLYEKNLLKSWHSALIDGFGLQEVYILQTLNDDELVDLVEEGGYLAWSSEKGIVMLTDINNDEIKVQAENIRIAARSVAPEMYRYGIALLDDDSVQCVKDWEDHILNLAADQWREMLRPVVDFPTIFHGLWEHELFHRVMVEIGEC